MARKRWRLPKADELQATAPEVRLEAEGASTSPGTIDPWAIRAEDLHTVEECMFLMAALDKKRDELLSQLYVARATKGRSGRYAPAGWYSQTVSLLNAVNIARNQVQDRRGVIRRQRVKARLEAENIRSERRFIEAAKRLLSREQYFAIWKEANTPPAVQENRPGGFSAAPVETSEPAAGAAA